MEILITIICIIIFLLGSYFMGNLFLDGFDDDWREQIINSLFGVLFCIAIIAIIMICYSIYLGIHELFLVC